MKNKKTLFIIGGAVVATVLAIIVIVCAVGSKTPDTPQNTPGTGEDTTVSVGDIAFDDSETDGADTDGTSCDETEAAGSCSVLTPDEPPMPSTDSSVSTEPAVTPDAPVTEQTPKDDGEGGGITVGGGQAEKYDCGVSGHHCDGPETHAYVTNLELQGCPYCGKSNCQSFYATDEWGNTCYTPGKCPEYDIKKDPAEYCQDCGKKLGDGRNGTCVQFVTAYNCPNCKEYVDAWTCHSCK